MLATDKSYALYDGFRCNNSKLCYPDSEPIVYAKIQNNFGIPLWAELPYYDEMSSSMELSMHHMETGVDNSASRNVNQKLINKLF